MYFFKNYMRTIIVYSKLLYFILFLIIFLNSISIFHFISLTLTWKKDNKNKIHKLSGLKKVDLVFSYFSFSLLFSF